MRIRPSVLLLPVTVVAAGWACAAVGFKDVCGTMTGPDPMPYCGSRVTPLYYVGYWLAFAGALALLVLVCMLLMQRRRRASV
jgi:hypothetical protein